MHQKKPQPLKAMARGRSHRARARRGARRPLKKETVQREISAGGIVFRKSGKNISFALMKDSYGKWTFPKGHVEAAEDLEEAAARETLEELGLEEIRLLDYLGKIDIWFRDKFHKKDQLIHKDIHFYLFEAFPGSALHPDPSEHVLEAKWVPLSTIGRVSSYRDMIPIIKRAVELVKRIK